MIKLFLYIIFISIFAIVPSFAERPLEWEGWNFISKEKNTAKPLPLILLPDFTVSNKLLQSVLSNNPELSIEMLYEMPFPETGGEDLYLFLFNRLNSFSSMKGIQYYSTNKDRMTLYLEKSYAVAKKGSKKSVNDPVFTTLPKESSFIIYQKDTTFGSNWYSVNIELLDDAIWLRMTNVSRMKYFFIPVMNPGDVIIDIIIIPGKDRLQLYTLSQLRKSVREILGKKIYLPGVFDHRVSAIQGWFAHQIYTEPIPGQIK